MYDFICNHAGYSQVTRMATSFTELPCKVLWRLTPSEISDASASFSLGINTKVHTPASSLRNSFLRLCVGQTTSGQRNYNAEQCKQSTASALLMQLVTWMP